MNGFFKDLKTIERMTDGTTGQYIARYAAQLHEEGYARKSGKQMLKLVDDFVQWLKRKRVAVHQIRPDHGKKYQQFRRRRGYPSHRGDRTTLARWFKLLQKEGIIPKPVPQPITPSQHLLEEYDRYLQKERSLSWATRITYRPLVAKFLTGKFDNGPVELSTLRALDVIKFVQRCAKRLGTKRAQLMTSALRSFLQFARYHGDLNVDLTACVPSVAGWTLSGLPKSLPVREVAQVLAQCRRATAVGRRDYAILLLLARLGLRAGEVVNLTLEDIDWDTGRISIRGKGNRVDQLPLPTDVGEAIAAYLQHDRPHALNTRRLFIRVRAPLTGFRNSIAIASVVRHALARAGIDSPRKGAHQFRHTLASELLRQGHSLSEIGEILRHRSPETTAIYAKVDLLALRPLALPWPGGRP